MTSIAVVAHRQKHLGGGLAELRSMLAAQGFADPLWFEVDKSSKSPARVRRALAAGADLVFIWGGDGMVQHCLGELSGSGAAAAILPAGTANLFAANLGIPVDLAHAVETGLHGDRRTVDLGVMNGERFAVLAGAGFDARIMHGVTTTAKARFGSLAYVWSSRRAGSPTPTRMSITIDGRPWFDGPATCVLFGNVGTVTGGLEVFPDALPDDGLLEIGVVTARSTLDWLRVLVRVVGRHPDRSPMVRTSRGRRFSVRLHKPLRYELDGGARGKVDRIKVHVEAGAVRICVPRPVASAS